MKKLFTKLMAVLAILLLGTMSVFAQDLTIGQPTAIAGWTASAGAISVAPGGTTLPTVSSGSATCLTGNTLRIGSNAAYLQITSSTGYVISRLAFDATGNSATISPANIDVIAYSTNGGTTWCSEASALTFTVNGYNSACTNYDNSTLPANVNAIRIWRKYVNGGAGIGSGGTIRMGNLKVWATASCSPGTAYNVSGTTSILSGGSTDITLDGSTAAVDYQLYKGGVAEGGVKPGTGSPLTWSVTPAIGTSTYTVKSVGSASVCQTAMIGSAVVTVTSSAPAINLTSAGGTNAQTPTVNNAITPITYSIASGTATTAAVTWTGTVDANTPPAGITVNFTSPTLTISGTPTAIGNYGYTATTDGSPAANATGTINVSLYKTGDYKSVATSANWGVASTWNKWNGSDWVTSSDFPNATTANVYIANGTEINAESSNRSVNNLTVEGTLTSSGSNASIYYLNIYGDLTVNTGGFIGDVNNTSGDGYDGISLNIYGSNSKITGNGGSIYLGRLRTNLAGQTLTIDHDITAIYYGSTNQGGHTVSVYPNGVDNTTITINPGKTLTLAPWSVLGTSTSSYGAGAYNFTVNVNGTLDIKDLPAPNAQTPSEIRSMIYGGTASGKTFSLNIGSTGIVNVPQFYPNGTVSGGGTPTGSTSAINIASGGVLNVSQILDLRQTSQTITGEGTLNLLSGAEIKIGSADGLNGHILTTTANYDASTKYNYAGTVAQVTGSALPSSINNLVISNIAGVSLSKTTAVGTTLTVNAGALLKNGGYTLTNNGVATINGSFQIDEGGWATGTDFIYGSASTLIFNNTSGSYGVASDAAYWPYTNGPKNVTVNTGGITLNAWRSVDGLFQTASGVIISGGQKLTVNGQLQVNSGGYISTNSPEYGAASTLVYNNGAGGFTSSLEWPSTLAPFNVEIKNATPVTMSTSRSIAGNLALTSGSIATGANTLTLAGAISGAGTINTENGALTFAGTSEQTLAAANVTSGTVNNLVVNAGSKLNSTGTISATNLTINSDVNGTGTLKGTLTSTNANVNQYLTYRTWYMSSPVASASPSGMGAIKYFDETVAGNSWPAATTMTAGKGYFVTPIDDEDHISNILFNGTLNSGNQDITLTRTLANTEKPGFNLIGNPYPSYLDWTAVCSYSTDGGTTHPNQDIMPTTTMWYRTKASGTWDFVTVNGEGVKSPSEATATKYIPPMQAFWVKAKKYR